MTIERATASLPSIPLSSFSTHPSPTTSVVLEALSSPHSPKATRSLLYSTVSSARSRSSSRTSILGSQTLILREPPSSTSKYKTSFNVSDLNAYFKKQSETKTVPLNESESLGVETFGLTADEITNLPKLPTIKKLVLTSCWISEPQFSALIHRLNTTLESLTLKDCFGITPQIFKILPPLQHLSIDRYPGLDDASLETLLSSSLALHAFSCPSTQITSIGLQWIVNHFKNLTYLDLSFCTNLTKEDFLKLKTLSQLQHLNVTGCLVDITVFEALSHIRLIEKDITSSQSTLRRNGLKAAPEEEASDDEDLLQIREPKLPIRSVQLPRLNFEQIQAHVTLAIHTISPTEASQDFYNPNLQNPPTYRSLSSRASTSPHANQHSLPFQLVSTSRRLLSDHQKLPLIEIHGIDRACQYLKDYPLTCAFVRKHHIGLNNHQSIDDIHPQIIGILTSGKEPGPHLLSWTQIEKQLHQLAVPQNLDRMRPVLQKLWAQWIQKYAASGRPVKEEYRDLSHVSTEDLEKAILWISQSPAAFKDTKTLRFEGLAEKLTLIPSCIAELPLSDLRSLSFDDNEISFLPEPFFKNSSHLQYFSIMNNALSALPPYLTESWPDIEILQCCENKIAHLPGHLGENCTKLKIIWLQSNQLTTISPDFYTVLSNLARNKLQILNVEDNYLKPDDIEKLTTSLPPS